METLVRLGIANAVWATVLAIAVAGAARLCRQPALVHALWFLVLVRLVIPPLRLIPIPWPEPPLRAPTNRPAPKASTPSSNPAPGDGKTPLPHGRGSVAAVATRPLPRRTPKAATSRVPAREAGWVRRVPAELPVGAVWLAGSVSWLLLAGVRIVRFGRLVRTATPAPGTLDDRTRELAGRLGLARPPRVGMVPGVVSPLLWAIGGTPLLLLPRGLWGRLDPAQRDALLVHELAHLRRRDHWVRGLELAATALYWWHPVTWWARRRMREAEEQCCDAWVVATLPGAARAYAAALLEAVDFLAETRPALPLAASGIGQVADLKRRLTMILRGTTPKGLSWPGRLVVLGLAAVLLPWLPMWAQRAPRSDSSIGHLDAMVRSAGSGQGGGIAEADVDNDNSPASVRQRLGALQAEIRELEARLRQKRNQRDRVEQAVRGRFRNRRNLDQADDEIELLERELEAKRDAVEDLAQADDELRARLGDAVELLEAQVQARKAMLREAEARVEQAEGQVANASRLHATKVIGAGEFAHAQGDLKIAKAQRDAREAELRETEARLRQARRRLARLDQPVGGLILEDRVFQVDQAGEDRDRGAVREWPGTTSDDPDLLTPIRVRFECVVEKLHVAPGQTVARGDPLADLFSSELAEAKNAFRFKHAQWVRAKNYLDQARKQVEQIGLPKQAFHDAGSNERRSRLELDVLRDRLSLLGLMDDEIEATAKDDERSAAADPRMTLRAPCPGVVTRREAVAGNLYEKNTVLMAIAARDRLAVWANVPESELATVRPGQGVDVEVPSLRRTFSGTVVEVASPGGPGKPPGNLRLSVPNPDGSLTPGLTVRVRLATVPPAPKSDLGTRGERTVYLVVMVNREKAAGVGLTVEDVMQGVRSELGSRRDFRLEPINRNESLVEVQDPGKEAETLAQELKGVRIGGGVTRPVALGAVAEVQLVRSTTLELIKQALQREVESLGGPSRSDR